MCSSVCLLSLKPPAHQRSTTTQASQPAPNYTPAHRHSHASTPLLARSCTRNQTPSTKCTDSPPASHRAPRYFSRTHTLAPPAHHRATNASHITRHHQTPRSRLLRRPPNNYAVLCTQDSRSRTLHRVLRAMHIRRAIRLERAAATLQETPAIAGHLVQDKLRWGCGRCVHARLLPVDERRIVELSRR